MVKTKNPFLASFTLITIIVVLIDQITKELISRFKPSLDLGILKIQYLTNTGAAFGILRDKLTLLTIISIIVVIIVIILYKDIPKTKWPQLSLALFLGGVIGNLIDRLFRGMVIDFINLSFWPAFNVADMAISIGVLGMILTLWKS